MIILLCIISAVGCFFTLLLWVRLREIHRTRQLRQYRSKEAGLSDLLNYAAIIADGVVIGKNGALIAGWEYRGEDHGSMTHEQRDAISARLNQAVARMGSGWMFHIDAVRHEVNPYAGQPPSRFPDPVSEAIEQERRTFFAQPGVAYETTLTLVVTYLPVSKAVRKLSEIIYHDDAPPLDDVVAAQNTLKHFEREISNLEHRLSNIVTLRRLRSRRVSEDGRGVVYDDLLSHLQYCVTGLRHPIRLPSTPVYLDSILGGQEIYTGVVPRIGRRYLQVVGIDGFPSESFPSILARLGEQPASYRWSTRCHFLESWEALSHIERFRSKWQQQVVPFIAQVFNITTSNLNHDAQAMVDDATEARVGISGGYVGACYYTSTLLFCGEDRAQVEHNAREAEKLINNIGFSARIESVNTIEAWLGSLPGHGTENVRRPLVNTMNLADFLPLSSIWPGEQVAPCPFYPAGSPPLMHCLTTGNAPFALNLHVRDVGNTVIFGPVGTGKSTILGALAAQSRRYHGMTVYCFDRGMSMYTLCSAVGGTHYHPASDDDKLNFCPLQYLEEPSDRVWAAEWVEQICELSGVHVTHEQRNKINTAIESMRHGPHRSLTDFVIAVQDEQTIRALLTPYTIAGPHGNLFDATHDTLSLDTFGVFEMEALMALSPKYALPALLYLFHRIERSLTGQPALLIVDEAWLALGHTVFRNKIGQWLRDWRKKNCALVLATQSLSDAIGSGIIDLIKESTATHVFLPNPNARDVDGSAIYRRFGLSDQEIEIIAESTPKQDYYCRTDDHQRLINLVLGPLALAFVGVSDKDSVAQVKKCQRLYGDQWISEWLGRRGLSLKTEQKPSSSLVAV